MLTIQPYIVLHIYNCSLLLFYAPLTKVHYSCVDSCTLVLFIIYLIAVWDLVGFELYRPRGYHNNAAHLSSYMGRGKKKSDPTKITRSEFFGIIIYVH